LKICFLPRYGRGAASSRLRVFAVADAMNAHGLAEACIGFQPDADVVVIQKAVDWQTFAPTQVLGFPGRVVYDLDDVIDDSILRTAGSCADLITVDTEGRAADIRSRLTQHSRTRRVAVIPDCLDYEAAGAEFGIASGITTSVVWFGNYPNFESARWMFAALAAERVRVGAISDLSEERAGIAVMRLTPWIPETFPQELRKWGMVALSHRGADPDKSVNKMAAAYHLGVPCIVNDSASYREMAEACGIGWTYVKDQGGLFEAWGRLTDPAEQERAVAAVQPVIWERYRAEAVARLAVETYSA